MAERPWGFNSPLSHQQSISIIQTRVSLSTSLLPLILAAIRSSRAHEIVRLGAVPIPYYLEVKNFLEKARHAAVLASTRRDTYEVVRSQAFEHAANRAPYETIVDTLVDQFGRCWLCCLLEGLQRRTGIRKQSRFSKGQSRLRRKLRSLPQQRSIERWTDRTCHQGVIERIDRDAGPDHFLSAQLQTQASH